MVIILETILVINNF